MQASSETEAIVRASAERTGKHWPNES